jgi:hypothetical protein
MDNWPAEMELQENMLRFACFKLARNRLWQMRLVDTAKIERLADSFYEIAINHLELMGNRNRDPNILVRAVRYLEQIDALPPTDDDAQWFQQTLTVLIELACPSVRHTEESCEFLTDVEEGIAEGRSDLIEVESYNTIRR